MILNIHMKKSRIPSSLRKAVIDRDGYFCVYCDDDLTDGEIHLDHIIPESRGGPTSYENLQVTCRKCNTAKGVLSESEFMHRLRQRAISILNRLGEK
jgi:5-methylcytosine-specific restriction endonuclease McrA